MKPSNDHEAMTLILQGLEDRGCKVTHVIEDNWNPDDVTPVSSIKEAVELLDNLDEGVVWIDLPSGGERENSFIFFVLGNDPEEVACDYGVSLSPYIDPIVDPWWE